MGKLDNPRHEAFAQGLAKGEAAAEAYRKAGYKPDYGAASRLSGNIKVRARVAELQEMHARQGAVTIERITEMLLEDRKLAEKEGQAGAAVSATQALAKLHGLMVDRQKVESENVTYTVSDQPMNENEWETEFGGDEDDLGAAAGSADRPH